MKTDETAGSDCTVHMGEIELCALRSKVDDDEEEIEKSIKTPNRKMKNKKERPPAMIRGVRLRRTREMNKTYECWWRQEAFRLCHPLLGNR